MDKKTELIIGTYQNAGQKALRVLGFDLSVPAFCELAADTQIDAPSFAIGAGEYIFAVSEKEDGMVASFRYDRENKRLVRLSGQKTKGGLPCYLHFDRRHMALYAANYGTGSVSVFPVDAAFRIGACMQLLTHEGRSVVRGRQECAHAHSVEEVTFAPDYKIVQDLGSDALWLYRTQEDGKLEFCSRIAVPSGHGPRHVAFGKKKQRIYVACELANVVDVYQWEPENCRVKLIQTVSTLPVSYRGENTVADIHVWGDDGFLLVSNRGHDSIAVFKILEDGCLALREIAFAGGKNPRNFLPLPQGYVLIAAQDSAVIRVARLSESGGLELLSASYPIEFPVCVRTFA